MNKWCGARNIAKIKKLTTELGREQPVDALKDAIEMRTALRVIHTWSSFDGLDVAHVQELCKKALRMP